MLSRLVYRLRQWWRRRHPPQKYGVIVRFKGELTVRQITDQADPVFVMNLFIRGGWGNMMVQDGDTLWKITSYSDKRFPRVNEGCLYPEVTIEEFNRMVRS